MAYLYTPSTEGDSMHIEGSLYARYTRSLTVWLDDTGWHEASTADPEVLALATVVINRPVVVSDDTATSLLASSVGGTLRKMQEESRHA